MNKSHDYDKILTRLTTILQRLYSGETLGVTELAEEFNVSPKTIQRDFNERLIRFPIEKAGRRWRMQPGHRIEKVQDIDNLLTLQILETIAEGIGSGFAERSKSLLGRLKNDTGPIIRSYLSIEDVTSHTLLFKQIEEAIVSTRCLRFDYHKKRRHVHPYRIVNFDGYWYLLAREPASGLVKKFYIKEITNADVTTEPFTPDATLHERIAGALNAWFDPNRDPFELHLLAKAPIVKYLKRRPLSPTQCIVAEHAGRDLELTVRATSTQEALGLVKAWLPDLIVLGPPDVREAFENLLQKTLRRQTGHDAV
ncbi:helix-turn-helix transcriptional regulator [Hydrogenimonas urashimensis]|uniref:helix-turn-helix transcriptional regulator n=1 Tax=Hydrogenimonas urashimensis TaxID=2740515 RepID=UPI001916C39B|nr:WYL domain-containing transcriptional regulator [Hydrogenimonas urashimensis]